MRRFNVRRSEPVGAAAQILLEVRLDRNDPREGGRFGCPPETDRAFLDVPLHGFGFVTGKLIRFVEEFKRVFACRTPATCVNGSESCSRQNDEGDRRAILRDAYRSGIDAVRKAAAYGWTLHLHDAQSARRSGLGGESSAKQQRASRAEGVEPAPYARDNCSRRPFA
jgi:hypothetical protein